MHRPKSLGYLQALVEVKVEVLRSLAGLIRDAMNP